MTRNQSSHSTFRDLTVSRQSPSEEELKLLVKMVEYASLSHHEAKLSSFLVEYMRGKGFSAYQDNVQNAVGILGSGDRAIVLLGHLDTVPGHIPVRIEQGKLFGRGSVDAKGSLACFISAASRLLNEAEHLNKKVIIVGAVEEEAATSRGAREVLRTFQPPDYCIVGEPSNWSCLTLGYKGRLLLDYTLKAPLKHTAAQGKMGCEEAIDFWNRIQTWCKPLNEGKGAFESIDSSVRSFNSENDGIYEHIQVRLGFRLPSDFPLEQFKNFLDGIAGSAQLHFSGSENAVRTGKSNPLVRAFLHSIRNHHGIPKFKVKTGTSDMNVIVPHWDCPIVAYGPGDSSLDHTPHEHIEIEEYGKAINVLESVLRCI